MPPELTSSAPAAYGRGVSELITRTYVEGDALAIADLMNLIEVNNGGDPSLTEGEVRGYLASLIKDLTRNSRIVVTPEGAVVGVAMTAAPPDGGSHADTFGGVHPEWRGRGIGRELFAWQVARLAEIHAERAPGVEWDLDAGTSVSDESGIRLFQRFGMRPERYFFDMLAPVGDVPAVPTPAGLRIVEYRDDMRAALYEAHVAAFADHWGSQRRPIDDWVALTVGSEEFRADLSRIALDGDGIAGYLLGYDGTPGKLYIGQVGTLRAWRRRGVAGALLAGALAAAAADGKALASLAVDADSPTGAVGVYERVGFTVRNRWVVYRRPLAA